MNCDFELSEDESRDDFFVYRCVHDGCDQVAYLDKPQTRIIARCKGKSRGLGDTVANITQSMHIRKCGGCKNRQKLANKLFPYKGSKDGRGATEETNRNTQNPGHPSS